MESILVAYNNIGAQEIFLPRTGSIVLQYMSLYAVQEPNTTRIDPLNIEYTFCYKKNMQVEQLSISRYKLRLLLEHRMLCNAEHLSSVRARELRLEATLSSVLDCT